MGKMHTITGKHFDPMKIIPENIDIVDIAHALSLMPRGGGQIRWFYSVAQHSINCAVEAKAMGYSSRVILACLFHDGSEAYIADIIRPVKPYLTNYLDIEKSIMDAIWIKIGINSLSESEIELVKEMDDKILYNELFLLIPGNENRDHEKLKSIGDFKEKDMMDVKNTFICMAKEYMEKIK